MRIGIIFLNFDQEFSAINMETKAEKPWYEYDMRIL